MTHPLSKALREKAIRDACNMQHIAVKTVEWQAADALDARAPTEAEWQDISTAPKDGSQLIVWQPQPFDTTHDGVKMARSPAGPYNAHWDVMDGAWCLSGGTWVGPFLKPTHWMPLPRKPGEPK